MPTVTPEALDRALDIIRVRVDQLGVGEPEIQRSGQDQISVGLPDVQNIRRAQAAGRHARAAVLLRLGEQRPHARRQSRSRRSCRPRTPTRSASARARGDPEPGAAALRRRQARLRDREADHEATETGRGIGSAYYLFDRRAPLPRRPGALAERTCCRRSTEPRLPADSEVLAVPQGYVVLQAVARDGRRASRDRRPDARASTCCATGSRSSGKDIKDPQQGFNERQAARRRVQIHRRRQGRRSTTSRATISQRGHRAAPAGHRPARRAAALRRRARRQTDLGRLDRPAAAARTASTARTAR